MAKHVVPFRNNKLIFVKKRQILRGHAKFAYDYHRIDVTPEQPMNALDFLLTCRNVFNIPKSKLNEKMSRIFPFLYSAAQTSTVYVNNKLA